MRLIRQQGKLARDNKHNAKRQLYRRALKEHSPLCLPQKRIENRINDEMLNKDVAVYKNDVKNIDLDQKVPQ
jgi:hypothetical protein